MLANIKKKKIPFFSYFFSSHFFFLFFPFFPLYIFSLDRPRESIWTEHPICLLSHPYLIFDLVSSFSVSQVTGTKGFSALLCNRDDHRSGSVRGSGEGGCCRSDFSMAMVTFVGVDLVTLCLGWSSSRPRAEMPPTGLRLCWVTMSSREVALEVFELWVFSFELLSRWAVRPLVALDRRALLLHHGLRVVLVSCSCKGVSAQGIRWERLIWVRLGEVCLISSDCVCFEARWFSVVRGKARWGVFFFFSLSLLASSSLCSCLSVILVCEPNRGVELGGEVVELF